MTMHNQMKYLRERAADTASRLGMVNELLFGPH